MTRRRSVFTALSLWLSLAPVVIFAVMGAAVILMSSQALRNEVINQINDDMAALVLIDAEDGADALINAVTQRLTVNSARAGAPYYRLSNDRARAIGNLERSVRTYTEPVALRQGDMTVLVRGTPLRGERVLIVGRDLRAVNATLRTLIIAIILGAASLALLSFLLTRHHIERLRQRTAALNGTFDKIADGHLETRITISKRADELDDLGAHINTMLDRLHRLLTLRKRLTDQLAHEIRSPLARLDATLANSGQTGGNGQSGVKSVEAVRDDLGRTLVLLDGLLDISALEAQAGDRRNFERVPFSALLTEVFDLFEPLAETHGYTMMLNAEDEIAVSGDRSQLGRLISNLLDNAIKYASEGPITVSLSRRNGSVFLSVINRGPEIGPALTSEIFTPFFRNPDAPRGKGHGLGLALCQSIAARHGGTLSVESTGGLTTFQFQLPLGD